MMLNVTNMNVFSFRIKGILDSVFPNNGYGLDIFHRLNNKLAILVIHVLPSSLLSLTIQVRLNIP